MSLKEELTTYISDTFRGAWTITKSGQVPTDDDAIGLGNYGIEIEAAVMYADLTDSTGLVNSQSRQFAAEVYKSYVYAAAKCIRYEGGSVTAYDGDRVMGVFVGGTCRNDAVSASFRLTAVVEDIIQPQLNGIYGTAKFTVEQKVGIDYSTVLVANTGIRGNNDYVWVGPAANNAAKLAGLKRGYSTYVTSEVFSVLEGHNLNDHDGSPLWRDLGFVSELGYRVHAGNIRTAIIP